jgi:hypothetical protein
VTGRLIAPTALRNPISLTLIVMLRGRAPNAFPMRPQHLKPTVGAIAGNISILEPKWMTRASWSHDCFGDRAEGSGNSKLRLGCFPADFNE